MAIVDSFLKKSADKNGPVRDSNQRPPAPLHANPQVTDHAAWTTTVKKVDHSDLF